MKGNEMQSPDQPEWYTYVWVVLVAMVGGLVRWLNKIKQREDLTCWSLFILFVHLVTSGFVGVLTWLLCQSMHIDPKMSAFLVAIAGHMGILALELFQEPLKKIAQNWNR